VQRGAGDKFNKPFIIDGCRFAEMPISSNCASRAKADAKWRPSCATCSRTLTYDHVGQERRVRQLGGWLALTMTRWRQAARRAPDPHRRFSHLWRTGGARSRCHRAGPQGNRRRGLPRLPPAYLGLRRRAARENGRADGEPFGRHRFQLNAKASCRTFRRCNIRGNRCVACTGSGIRSCEIAR